jgi:hypothetical protein
MVKNNRPRPLISPQGSIIPDSFENEAFRGEYDGSNNLIYAGYARPGAGEGELVWLIFKMAYSGTDLTSITWPINSDGAVSPDYEFSWTNRATYTYV